MQTSHWIIQSYGLTNSNFSYLIEKSFCSSSRASCLMPSVKHGGSNIMAWGSFAGRTTGDLVSSTMRKEEYLNVLQNHSIPYGSRLVVFQQDNDFSRAKFIVAMSNLLVPIIIGKRGSACVNTKTFLPNRYWGQVQMISTRSRTTARQALYIFPYFMESCVVDVYVTLYIIYLSLTLSLIRM